MYPPPYVSVCPSLICFDRCLVWSFPTGSLSGLCCCLVAMIDLGCVLVELGISMELQVVGRRPTAGEPGTYLLLETYT